jgi:orotidine-5'-phosphate decarboxylase
LQQAQEAMRNSSYLPTCQPQVSHVNRLDFHKRSFAMTETNPVADDRLIVALDVPNVVQGLEVATKIGDAVSFYKIGLGMLAGGGMALANELKQEFGKKIFLDMKFFDIGATVEKAVKGVSQFDLDFLTVHGDPYVVKAAKEGAAGSGMKILAVTILTSLDREDLDGALIKSGNIVDLVQERAGNALRAGADGIICSPQEAALVRALPEAQGKLIVTPGVRPTGAALGDQKRVATPAQAIRDGVDHMVVGRPIWQHADPREAALRIQHEIANAAQLNS